MIADTNFLSEYHDEHAGHVVGPARRFAAAHRRERIFVTVISVGEVAVIFSTEAEARRFLAPYKVFRLTPEIAYTAAAIDRELIQEGLRLGENDNWIAAFCRSYSQRLISNDQAFDRVRGVRRLSY